MRVVLDTNVLVAAFISHGVCAEIFERVVGEHELIVSAQVLDEFRRVMSEKLGFDPGRVIRTLALLRRVGTIVEPEKLAAPVCRNSDDDALLALVRSSNADCLVTGDDDLLVLRTFEGAAIITPRAFLTHRPPTSTG